MKTCAIQVMSQAPLWIRRQALEVELVPAFAGMSGVFQDSSSKSPAWPPAWICGGGVRPMWA